MKATYKTYTKFVKFDEMEFKAIFAEQVTVVFMNSLNVSPMDALIVDYEHNRNKLIN